MQAKQYSSVRGNPYDFLPPPSTSLMARIAILVVTVVVLVLGSSNSHHVSERGHQPSDWGKEGIGRRRESSSQIQGLEGSSYADTIDMQLTALSGLSLGDTPTPSATRCESRVTALPPVHGGSATPGSGNTSLEVVPFDLFYRFWNFSNPRWKQLLAVHSFETRSNDPDPMGTRPQFNAFLSLCNRTLAPFLPVMMPKLGDSQCAQQYGNSSRQYLCMWSSQAAQGCLGCYDEVEEKYPFPTQPPKEVAAGSTIAYQLTLMDSTGISSFPTVVIEFRCCEGTGCDHLSAGSWFMGPDSLPMRKPGRNGTTTNTLVLPLDHRIFCVPPLTSTSPFRVFVSSGSSILPAVLLVALAGILFFVFVQVLHGNRLRWMRKAS